MNAIINYIEIALEGQLAIDIRENLIKAHAGSMSLIYVLNDLLDLTRIESGNDLFRLEVFDLPATIKEAMNMFQYHYRTKGLDFSFTMKQEFPRALLGDHVKIRQCVGNLIANAIGNTEVGGVSVECSVIARTAVGIQVEISVSDTGCGISPAMLDALFQDFEQG